MLSKDTPKLKINHLESYTLTPDGIINEQSKYEYSEQKQE